VFGEKAFAVVFAAGFGGHSGVEIWCGTIELGFTVELGFTGELEFVLREVLD